MVMPSTGHALRHAPHPVQSIFEFIKLSTILKCLLGDYVIMQRENILAAYAQCIFQIAN
jgi:hypothetical protein